MRFQDRLRSEAGFALPTAMFFILGILAILSIGAVAAVNTQRGTVRDANSKAALAIAESGADAAILRYVENESSLDEDSPCLDENRGPTGRMKVLSFDGTNPVNGWCPPVKSTDPGRPFTYWVRPYMVGEGKKLDIVAQSTVDNANRRIFITAAIEAGTRVIGSENVVGIDWLDMSNNAQLEGGAGSNGWVKMVGSAGVCGPLRSGANDLIFNNGSVYPKPGCENSYTTDKRDYPLPEPPADIATNNSNARAFVQDGASVPKWYKDGHNNYWSASTRTLELMNAGPDVIYDMTGTAPYFLCRLRIGGAQARMSAPGKSVQIFFDKPSNCPSLNGKPQLEIRDGGRVQVADPKHIPGFFFLGGGGSTISLQGGGSSLQDIVIYGPESTLELGNGFHFDGAMIAKTVKLYGGGNLGSTFDGGSYEIPVPGSGDGGIVNEQFLECRAADPLFEPEDPAIDC